MRQPKQHLQLYTFLAWGLNITLVDLAVLVALPGCVSIVPEHAPLCTRWLVLRICEANTQCLLKVCDLAKRLLDALYEQVMPTPSPLSFLPGTPQDAK